MLGQMLGKEKVGSRTLSFSVFETQDDETMQPLARDERKKLGREKAMLAVRLGRYRRAGLTLMAFQAAARLVLIKRQLGEARGVIARCGMILEEPEKRVLFGQFCMICARGYNGCLGNIEERAESVILMDSEALQLTADHLLLDPSDAMNILREATDHNDEKEARESHEEEGEEVEEEVEELEEVGTIVDVMSICYVFPWRMYDGTVPLPVFQRLEELKNNPFVLATFLMRRLEGSETILTVHCVDGSLRMVAHWIEGEELKPIDGIYEVVEEQKPT